MSSASYTIFQNSVKKEVFYSTSLVGTGGSDASQFLNISGSNSLFIYRTSTGGTYALEADWSRDGTTSLFTETLTTVSGGRSNVVATISPYVKLRVRNTHSTDAFTNHETVVWADGS